MPYALAADILDIVNEGRDPRDNGQNPVGIATRWRICYRSYSPAGGGDPLASRLALPPRAQ
jgi:hypothetical protein